jgi:hypothetical protein
MGINRMHAVQWWTGRNLKIGFSQMAKRTVKTAKIVKLSAGQKAAETKRNNKAAAVAAAEAAAVAYSNMTAGQKAAHTKRANGTQFSAAAKAAETKRNNKAAGIVGGAVVTPRATVASVTPAVDTGVGRNDRALALALRLIEAGLV